jgi:hypothetical protein
MYYCLYIWQQIVFFYSKDCYNAYRVHFKLLPVVLVGVMDIKDFHPISLLGVV